MTQLEIQSFWLKYASALRAFIYAKVKNSEDTKDLLQEVFIKVYQNVGTLQAEEKAVGWVYSIARNTVYRFFQNRREKVALEESYFPTEMPAFSEEHKTLKDLAMNCFPLMEQIQTMPNAPTSQIYQLFLLHFPDAQKIPYKYAEALILTDIKGLSQQQLADKLGISLSGAKSRVQRGREKLKEMLMECCIFEFDARGQVVNYEPKKNACETCAKA